MGVMLKLLLSNPECQDKVASPAKLEIWNYKNARLFDGHYFFIINLLQQV